MDVQSLLIHLKKSYIGRLAVEKTLDQLNTEVKACGLKLHVLNDVSDELLEPDQGEIRAHVVDCTIASFSQG